MYNGPTWHRRVNKMTDAQVHAIYMKEQAKKAEEQEKKSKPDEEIPF